MEGKHEILLVTSISSISSAWLTDLADPLLASKLEPFLRLFV